MHNVDLCGVYIDEPLAAGSIVNVEDLFSSDLENLCEIYNSSPSDVKILLASIVDAFYLLINSDARNGEIERLNKTKFYFRELFYKKNTEKNSDAEKLLNICEDS